MVWQSGLSVCVCIVCRLWENNSPCVHKTEEGFSFAGTALVLLSQSELVAKRAVNLLLCVKASREWGSTKSMGLKKSEENQV